MALIDKIKAKYPNPRALVDEPYITATGYDVGGAICLYQQDLSEDKGGAVLRFPYDHFLAQKLMQLNTDLPADLAHKYASIMNIANDTGNFAEAWHVAQQALEYVAQQDVD